MFIIKNQFPILSISVFALAVMLSLGCKKAQPVADVPANDYLKTTVQYKNIQGVEANLLSLDIYNYSPGSVPKPVVIYVHGGGWRTGDKQNKLENKLSLFNSLNYIFVSINYRLSPNSLSTNPDRIKYPDHNNDVADAVKWIYENIDTYGGDPSKLVLIGHSAGAHLVSLTGTSQLFLPARGLPVNTLKGIASFDTEGYDVPSQSGVELYQNAFGTDYDVQVQASPIFSISSSISYPRFFIAKRGTSERIALADAFIHKLQSAGVSVSQVNGSQYDHEGINEAIGAPGETSISDPLKAFLIQCFQ